MARRRRLGRGAKKEVNWKRKLSLGGLILLLFCVLSAVGGYMWLSSYLSGASFRTALEDRLMREVRADHVKLGVLDWVGSKVGVPRAQVETRGVLEDVVATDIEVSLNRSALWDRVCHVPILNIRDLDVNLNFDRSDVELPFYERPEENFFSSFTPNRVRVDRVIIRNLDVHAASSGGAYSLLGAKMAVSPGKRSDAFSATVQGGMLKLPLEWVRESELESINIRYGNDLLELQDGIFRINPGSIVLDRASWERGSGEWRVLLRVNKADVGRLLLDDWKKKLTGSILGNVRLEGGPGGLRHVSGKVNLSGGVLTALPILDRLSSLWDERYRSLTLDEASATFSYPYNDPEKNVRNAWIVKDINISSKGLLRLQGYVIIGENNRLSGTLQIGIPARYVEMIPFLKDSVFNVRRQPDEGMLWANMNLSGTLDAPEDDLLVRVFSSLGSLTVGSAADAAAGAVNMATGVLRNIVPGGGDSARPGNGAAEEKKDGKEEKENPAGLMNKAAEGAGKAIDAAGGVLKHMPL